MILGNLIQDIWKFVNDSIDLYKDIYVKNLTGSSMQKLVWERCMFLKLL